MQPVRLPVRICRAGARVLLSQPFLLSRTQATVTNELTFEVPKHVSAAKSMFNQESRFFGPQTKYDWIEPWSTVFAGQKHTLEAVPGMDLTHPIMDARQARAQPDRSPS